MRRYVAQAMKDLVSDANFECSPQALSLQAMDTSHVALVQMTLRSDGFAHFRCDRNISMGDLLSTHVECHLFPVLLHAAGLTLFIYFTCRYEPWQHVKMPEVRGQRRHHHTEGKIQLHRFAPGQGCKVLKLALNAEQLQTAAQDII